MESRTEPELGIDRFQSANVRCPTMLLEHITPGTAAELVASGLVREEVRCGLCDAKSVPGDDQRRRGRPPCEPLRPERRGYDGFAEGECLEHLDPHAAAFTKRCEDNRGALDKCLDPRHPARHRDGRPGEGSYRWGRVNPDDRQMGVRAKPAEGRKDLAAKPDCGIDIRSVIKASRENDFTLGFREGPGGWRYRHSERIDPNP